MGGHVRRRPGARASWGCWATSGPLGEAFHITTDEVLTWNQIYQGIAEALGVEAQLVHISSDVIARVAPEQAGSLLGDKTWSVVFDNSKIKEFVPGFQGRHNLPRRHPPDPRLVRGGPGAPAHGQGGGRRDGAYPPRQALDSTPLTGCGWYRRAS